MSPLPEKHAVHPEMFKGLKGEEYHDLHNTIWSLSSDTRQVFLTPPERIVAMSNHQFQSADRVTVELEVDKSLLLRGPNLSSNLHKMLDTGVVPTNWRALNDNQPLREIFGVETSFDEDQQTINVRPRSGISDIKLKHEGLDNPISPENRNALLALSIAPGIFWKDLETRGFTFGILEGDSYDSPWRATGLASSFPDPSHHAPERTLISHSVQEIFRTRNNPRSAAKNTQPFGIFIDNRHR